MELDTQIDDKKEEDNQALDLDPETKKQAMSAPRIATPMYIQPVYYVGSGLILLILKDEFKQVMSRCLVSKTTMQELYSDLGEIFKEGD